MSPEPDNYEPLSPKLPNSAKGSRFANADKFSSTQLVAPGEARGPLSRPQMPLNL